MTLLIVLGSIFGYISIATITARTMYWHYRGSSHAISDDDSIVTFFSSIFWPLAAIVGAIYMIVVKPPKYIEADREKAREMDRKYQEAYQIRSY